MRKNDKDNKDKEVKKRKKAVVFAESKFLGDDDRDQSFITEGQNLKKFYAKNHPDTDVEIIPFYGDDEKKKIIASLKEKPEEVFIFGHSGGKIGGIKHEEMAGMLKDSNVANCYMGSCSFEKYSDPYKSLRNFNYRSEGSWYGVNQNSKDLKSAMYSKSWTGNPNDFYGASVVEPRDGHEYTKVLNRTTEKPIEFKNNTKMALPALLAAAPALISGVSQLFGNKRRKREEEKATAGMSRMSDIFSEQLEGDYMDTSEATGAMTQIDQNQQDNLAQINANSATQGLTDEARIAMMGRSQQATSGAIGGLAKSADLWRQRLLQQKQGALGNLYQVGQQNRQNFNQSISNIVNPLQKSIDTGFSSGAFDGM